MNPLFWWLPPIIATLAAMAWVGWAERQAQRAEQRSDSEIAQHSARKLARMAAALDKPLPGRAGVPDTEPTSEAGLRVPPSAGIDLRDRSLGLTDSD